MFHVQLTISSIITTILFSLLFALLLMLILKCNRLLANIKYELLLLCLIVPTIKLLIPLEILPLTRNINISYILPEITRFFYQPIESGMFTAVTRYQVLVNTILILSILNVARVLISYYLLLKECSKLPLAEDKMVTSLANQILQEKKKKISFTIRWTEKYDSPCVYGIFKPTILLKKENWSSADLECVLRHEITHYLHGDLWFRYLWLLLKAFCWWNPAIYILDRQLAKILEIRADEGALEGKELSFQKQYMEAIVHVSSQNTQNAIPFFASFQEKCGLATKQRIRIIASRLRQNCYSVFTTNLLLTLLISGLTLSMYCLIFEPYRKDIGVTNVVAIQPVTADNCFLIDNGDGTYDMYMTNIYTCTIPLEALPNVPIYESLDDIPQE